VSLRALVLPVSSYESQPSSWVYTPVRLCDFHWLESLLRALPPNHVLSPAESTPVWRALANPTHTINGHEVTVNTATQKQSAVPAMGYPGYPGYPYGGYPQMYEPPRKEASQNKLYVGKIPLDMDKQTLIDYFSRYGKVEDVVRPCRMHTGRPALSLSTPSQYIPKRDIPNATHIFAFVHFTDSTPVWKALAEPKHVINGHEVVVNTATHKAAAAAGMMMGRLLA